MAQAELVLTRSQWTKKLNERWREAAGDMIRAVFELGGWLWQAKDDLDHGEFQVMIQEKLEFSYNTANAFMRIREWADERRLKVEHVQRLLPPDWGTICKITRLDDETYERLVEEGVICPTLERNEVAKILRLQRVGRDRERVKGLKPADGKFSTLVIDPPWDYGWLSVGGASKPGYATMTHEQLLALDVSRWAADPCHVYLWTTNNFMTRASELIGAWGFQHKTVLTWIKTDQSGKVRLGLGTYFRNTTEHCLFGMIGDLGTITRTTPTHFVAPIGKHSEKPEAFYEIVRRESPLPAGELFQREPRKGFLSVFVPSEQEAAE